MFVGVDSVVSTASVATIFEIAIMSLLEELLLAEGSVKLDTPILLTVSSAHRHPSHSRRSNADADADADAYAMGNRKFIDKKKAATFQLLSRDTSDLIYANEPGSDRVFVRVDRNNVSFTGFEESHDNHSNYGGFVDDPNSIFADSPDDKDAEEFAGQDRLLLQSSMELTPLPDHIRREILELGFQDDGYNYLIHLREIKNSGGGSVYYHNPKAKFDRLPLDIKAYDASRVRISEENADTNDRTMYSVAEKTVNVRIQKAVDPEIEALLNETKSQFDSDVEDLEEDFVVRANLPEEGADIVAVRSLNLVGKPETVINAAYSRGSNGILADAGNHPMNIEGGNTDEKLRVRRLLDDQFDLLELQEYGADSDDDHGDTLANEDESLAEKLNSVLKGHKGDSLQLDDNYRAPAEFLHCDEISKDEETVKSAADVLRRCAEYAANYENTDEDDHEVIISEESSDESEAWDCETIITTYSNLDNHPGRIGVPEIIRKNKLAETVSGTLKSSNKNVISLHGKVKLPVDYLPQGRKATKEKVKVVAKSEQPKSRQHAQESKEEKKGRKAAVKEERREARHMKKEIKELYRCQAKHAQKVAAVSGPSSIHLI
ncbi:hypothetical protein Nepgr_025243 [Nepenthes gracilis]|uniref:Uncharacterized protein n=1 Tax=Nepenthes gracilis TaxID=150966 RepID=A0AAD3Y0V8_NEPGR|nr:hypothetical protein Nepgr_025243 [Nepenthes gracilis]